MKKTSSIVGYSLVGVGAALVIMGALPFFQGIHWEGVFLGLGSFAAGAWVLAGPEVRASLRRLQEARREGRRVPPRSPRGGMPAGFRIDPLLPVRILKLAREHAGILTVAQIAMELNVPLDVAQAGVEECVRAGNAVPDYDIPRGHALYRFPEFLAPEPGRD
jgi:hypothetical protein